MAILPPPSRPEDPQLTAARQRVVALEADLGNLRKGMVQQLTSAGKLLKAVFSIDQEYFGGRFRGAQKSDAVDPLRDLAIATQVAEAVSEELQGASAFADSPLLRDAIADLLQTFEMLRDASVEQERAAIAAVGLPIKPEAFKARIYPENNPLACLKEATDFTRQVVTKVNEVRDRFTGLKMMLEEAERARAEAEGAVTPVNVDQIVGQVADELRRTQSDLTVLSERFSADTHLHEQALAALRSELEHAREEAIAEGERRRADRAELRSLAAEVSRQAARIAPDDDLEISLAVLREAIDDNHDTASLAAATEAVVLDWIRVSDAAQAQARIAGLDEIQTATTTQATTHEAHQRDAEQTLRSEREASQRQLAAAISDRDRLKTDLDRASADLTSARAAASLAATQATQQAEQALAAAKRATDERAQALAQLRAEYDQLKTDCAGQLASSGNAGRELATLREQYAAAERQLSEQTGNLTKAEQRTFGLTVARDTAIKAKTAVDEELAKATRSLADALAQTEALRSERDRLKTDLDRNATHAGDAGKELTTLRGQLTTVEGQLKIQLATSAAYEKQAAELSESRELLAKAKDKAEQNLAAVQLELAEQAKVLVTARVDNERLKTELAKATAIAHEAGKELASMRGQLTKTEERLASQTGAIAASEKRASELIHARDAALAAQTMTGQQLAAAQHAAAEQSKILEISQRECARLASEMTQAVSGAAASASQDIAAWQERLTQAESALQIQMETAREQLVEIVAVRDAALADKADSDAALMAARSELHARSDEWAAARSALECQAADRERVGSAAAVAAAQTEQELAALREQLAEALRQVQAHAAALADHELSTVALAQAQDEAQASAAASCSAAQAAAQAEAERQGLELETLRGKYADSEQQIRVLESHAAGAAEALRQRDAAAGEWAERLRSTQTLTEQIQNELDQVRSQAADLASEHAKVSANLEYTAVRERQLEQELVKMRAERQDLTNRLDALRKSQDSAVGQVQAELQDLRSRIDGAETAARDATTERDRLAGEAAALGERAGQWEKDLARLAAESQSLHEQHAEAAAERDRLSKRLADVDVERVELRAAAEAAEAKQRELAQETERQRIAEQEARRAEVDATSRAQRLTGDLTVVREKLGELLKSRDQIASRESRLAEIEQRLTGERDAALATADKVVAERDRLKNFLDQVRAEQADLDHRREAQEAQATARLTETGRQLSELRQASARLVSENERLQAEAARLTEAEKRRPNTGSWSKRLQESLAAIDDARKRADEAERITEEHRQLIANLESRLARQQQAEVNLKEQVADLDEQGRQTDISAQRITDLEHNLDELRSRLDQSEQAKRDQRRKFENVLVAAREAVGRAKELQERSDADDRVIIADLLREVKDLRMKTGTMS